MKTKVRSHKRKGKRVKAHRRKIKHKVKKEGFFGPSKKDRNDKVKSIMGDWGFSRDEAEEWIHDNE